MRDPSRSRRSARNVSSALSLKDLEDAVPPVEPPIGVTDVFLRRLSVEPNAIEPFGAAVLSWEVDAPPSVRVKINSEFVQQAGSTVVQPASSSTYRVFALSGSRSRQLGDIGLAVNLSACSTFELLQAKWFLEGAVTTKINEIEGLYTLAFAVPVVVEFQPDRVTCRLNLGYELDNRPNPKIRIDCRFGLGVNDGRLVSWGEQVWADVRVPKWAWLIPGALPGLAIALEFARDTATESGFEAIAGMVEALEFWWAPGDGMRRHSVKVHGPSEDGVGRIEVTECPWSLLDRFAAFDENRAVIK